jgi:hypothetical protein
MAITDGLVAARDVRRPVRGYILTATMLIGVGIGSFLTGAIIQTIRPHSQSPAATR